MKVLHSAGWDDRLDDGDPAVQRLLEETEMQGGSGGYHDRQKGESISCLCLDMRHYSFPYRFRWASWQWARCGLSVWTAAASPRYL